MFGVNKKKKSMSLVASLNKLQEEVVTIAVQPEKHEESRHHQRKLSQMNSNQIEKKVSLKKLPKTVNKQLEKLSGLPFSK